MGVFLGTVRFLVVPFPLFGLGPYNTAMCYTSLADFLEELERLGELRSVDAEVDRVAEVDVRETAVIVSRHPGEWHPSSGRLACDRGPRPPCPGNRLGRWTGRAARQALAAPGGTEATGTAAERVLARFAPATTTAGACQKIVRHGHDVDTTRLPVPRGSERESHPVITAGQLVSRDPASGRLVSGHAELSVRSERELGVHWLPHEPLARLSQTYRDRGVPMPLAVALGGPPVNLLAAMASLPVAVDRFALAGFLAGKPVELVRCRTVDLEVPADVEMVFEGTIDPAAAEVETGPTATPLGHDGASRRARVLQLTAWTHRPNPVFPAVVHGPASGEWVAIHRAMHRILLPLLRTVVAELVDCNLPECGHGRQLAWVAIRQSDAGAARRVARAAWQLPATRFCKTLVLVDEGVDVHDGGQIWQAVATKMDPRRDVFFEDAPPDAWEPAGTAGRPVRRMALDATGQEP